MGCASSAEAIRTAVITRQEERMGNMMANMATMQQQQLAKQQQMVRDDPECKQIFDQQTLIQQKILTATQAGDGAGVSQGQIEMMELQKNPKWMKMMMPDMQQMTKVMSTGGRTGGASTGGGNTRVTTHNFTSSNFTNTAPMAAAFPAYSATTDPDIMFSATGTNDPSSMFSTMASGGGFGHGGTTDYGGGTTDYGGGTTDFSSSY